ncbi:MAG: acyl-CoA synthetase [Gammaproteobacteria bacterium]|nr:acyl-CoA synthetase [Gammaproteobacteria bacterium]
MNSELTPLTDRTLDSIVMQRGNREITLSDLISDSQRLASSLPDAAFYIQLCKDRYNFVIAFCAALLRGATNILPPNKQTAVITEIGHTYPDCVCLYDADMKSTGLPAMRITDLAETESLSQPAEIPKINSDHIAAITFTSGSTNKPKPYTKKWRTLLGTAKKIKKRLFADFENEATVVSTVSSQHMYGLEMTVMMMLYGHCKLDASHPFYASDIVTRLENISPPRILVTTPIHLRSLLGANLQIPEIKKVISATASLPDNLASEIEKVTGGIVEEIYGCTETGACASRRTLETSHWDLFDQMSISEKDHEFLISGDNLDEATPVQDKLKILSATQFEFVGRTSDLLKVAGKRASLADLNNSIMEIDGVVDAVVFIPDHDNQNLSQRPAALIVTKLSKQAISKTIAKLIDPVFIPRPIKIVTALPRAENGKIQRAELMKLI